MANKNSEVAIDLKLKDDGNAEKHLKGVNDQLEKTGNIAQKGSGGLGALGGALGTVASVAGGLIVAEVLTRVAAGITEIATASVDSAFNLSEFNAKLGTIFQDNQSKIDEFNKSVDSFGWDIPNQEIDQIREYALSLANVGYSSAETEKIMKQLGDITLVVGKDKFGAFVEVLKKVGERGKMTSKELLLMQMSGIDLGKTMGKTDEELQKMVDEGKVGVNDLKTAFEKLTSEGGKYHDATKRYNESLAGSWDDVGDRIGKIQEKLGEKLIPVISAGIDWLSNMWTTIEEKFRPTWERLLPIFDQIGQSIGVIFDAIDTIFSGAELKGLNEQLDKTFSDFIVEQAQKFANELKKFSDWLKTPEGIKTIDDLKMAVENVSIMFGNLVTWFNDPKTKEAFDKVWDFIHRMIDPFYNLKRQIEDAQAAWNRFWGIQQAKPLEGVQTPAQFQSKPTPAPSGISSNSSVSKYIPNALGTSFFQGGNALVGERGAEVVSLPRGARITPADKVAGAGITVNVNGNIFGIDNFKQVVIDAVKEAEDRQNMQGKYNLAI